MWRWVCGGRGRSAWRRSRRRGRCNWAVGSASRWKKMTRMERCERDQGFELAQAFDQASVAVAEEGVGLRGAGGGFAEHAFEVGVALAGLAGPAAVARIGGCAGRPWPRSTRRPAVRNRLMSRPISPRTACAVRAAEPGISSRRASAGSTARRPEPRARRPGRWCGRRRRSGRSGHGRGSGSSSSPVTSSMRAVELVELAEQQPGQPGVMVGEPAVQGLVQGGSLEARPALRQLGQHLGVALTGDQRLDHRPAGDARARR